jgi:hypothetical protein
VRETKNGAMAAIFCLPPPFLAWIFTRKAPDPANERSGAGKPAPGAQRATLSERRQRADPARRRPSRPRRGGRGRYARSPEADATPQPG